MTPSPSPQLSDKALDDLIDAVRPEIRKALRGVLEAGAPCAMFEMAQQPLANGQKWAILAAIMIEPFGILAHHTLMDGMQGLRASFDKQNQTAAPVGFQIPV